MIRIIIADDHTLFRVGLRQMLHSFAGLAVVWALAMVNAARFFARKGPELVVTRLPPAHSNTHIVGVPKICALPPAASMPCTAASASRCRPALQGVIVEWPLATPIIGFLKSPSS